MTKLFILFALLQLCVTGRAISVTSRFCRRIGHSSTSKNKTIYISGGVQTVIENDTDTVVSGILDVMIEIDVSQSWDAEFNLTSTTTPKRLMGTVIDYTAPLNVNYGALFGGHWTTPNLWQFGGTSTDFNVSAQGYQKALNTDFAIWKYDSGAKAWSTIDTSTSLLTIPSRGAATEAAEQGWAFYLGGVVDHGTAATTESSDNATMPLEGMVVLNTDTGRVTNVTVRPLVNSNRRGAGLEYIGTFGAKGFLVLMGGHDQTGMVSLEQIAIFDIESLDLDKSSMSGWLRNSWYLQNTSGEVPSPRQDFCLVHFPAQDNSSVNIYLYGGQASGTFFDDIYVLSLPSFTWTKVFSGANPRWRHTCHRAGKRQMVSIGGVGNSSDYLFDCDQRAAGVGVFDASTLSWGSYYNAFASAYLVPDPVIVKIGGVGTGGAAKTTPDGGFTHDHIAKLFATRNTLPSSGGVNDGTAGTGSGSIATSNQDSSTNTTPEHLSAGAIAGIAIAVTVLVSCVIAYVWIVLRNKRSSRGVAYFRDTEREHNRIWIREAPAVEKHELPLDSRERVELREQPMRAEMSVMPKIPMKPLHMLHVSAQQISQTYGTAELE